MKTTKKERRDLMDAIYPITALQKRQKEVKQAAKKGIVRITEQGVGAYVFSSEKAYEESIRKAVSEALYEAHLHEAIAEARADVREGRVYDDVDGFFEELEEELTI